ncbi:MAG: hypothetical protein E5X10_09800 [Mesorhizobium sp.]|nr:MAG: hypothetical protein E5X10_09800 [Mesorhizobium sp.]
MIVAAVGDADIVPDRIGGAALDVVGIERQIAEPRPLVAKVGTAGDRQLLDGDLLGLLQDAADFERGDPAAIIIVDLGDLVGPELHAAIGRRAVVEDEERDLHALEGARRRGDGAGGDLRCL